MHMSSHASLSMVGSCLMPQKDSYGVLAFTANGQTESVKRYEF
jgi:hypothetical protein